jgi:hypothetical protein
MGLPFPVFELAALRGVRLARISSACFYWMQTVCRWFNHIWQSAANAFIYLAYVAGTEAQEPEIADQSGNT